MAGRALALAFAGVIGLANLGIQFGESDRAVWRLVLMVAAWSLLALLGYRRARTVREIKASQTVKGSDRGRGFATAAAGAGAVGAALAQAYAEEASGIPLVMTLVWLVAAFATGVLWFLVLHGDGTRGATGVGADRR